MLFLVVVTLIFVFPFINANGAPSACFSPDNKDPSLCNSCGHSYFYDGLNASAPFPISKCQPKQNSSLSLKLLVLTHSSPSICEECSAKSFIVEKGLDKALLFVSESCKTFMICDAQINLEASGDDSPHIFMMSSDYDFFRRTIVNLTLQPLACGVLNSGIPCAQTASYYQRVLIKFSKLKIYISGSVKLKKILLDGSDLNITKSNDLCWNTTICCSSSRMELQGDECNPRYKEVSPNLIYHSFGLFNLELLVDNSEAPVPSLVIDGCKFVNFYVPGYSLGFTALAKAAGLTIFSVIIKATSFENVFLLEGVLTTARKVESLSGDFVYQSYSYDNLTQLFNENFQSSVKECTLYLAEISIKNYNSYSVSDLTKTPASTYLTGIILQLEKASFNNIYLDNIELVNINNQTQKQFYLISFSREASSPIITIKNVIAKNVSSFGLIYIFDSSNLTLTNISLSQWAQTTSDALFYFQNVSQLRVEGVFLDFVLSKSFKAPVVLMINCETSQITNINIRKSIGLSIEIGNTKSLEVNQINFVECQYRNHLFYSENSIFSVNRFNAIAVTAHNAAAGIIFSFRSPIFNLSFVYINGASAEAVFDYRNAQSVYINSFLIENITSIRAFFLISTTFYATLITNLTFQNSILPRFAEFLNVANFQTYTPVMNMIMLNLINLTLPAVNSDVFAAFTKMGLILRDCIFENVKRIDTGPTTPFGIILISRLGFADFQNCSFKAVGYTFAPRQLQGLFNYPLIFISYSMKYSIRYCVFESDETVSLNIGFIASGQVYISSEITNCRFFVKKKNPNFIYKGVAVIQSPLVNLINNSFANLTPTPYNMFSHLLRSGVLLVHGEETLSFLKNSKTAEIHNISFENCSSENGGGLHISNYHILSISNIIFQESFANSGGSWAIVASSNISVINITILSSFAYEAATVLLENIVYMYLTNYLEAFSSGQSSGSWKIFSSRIICRNVKVFNSSTTSKGGFATLFASTLEISGGLIRNSSASDSGGSFWTALGSILLLGEVNVRNTRAAYGGFVSGDDAFNLSIRNSFVKEAVATLNGACFFFELVLTSFIENLTIMSSSSKSSGVIYIKTADESSIHNFKGLVCQGNSAPMGSCIYFRSSSQLYLDDVLVALCSGTIFAVRNDLPCRISINNMTVNNLVNVESLLEVEGLHININKLQIQSCSFRKYIIIIKASNATITKTSLFNNSGLGNQKQLDSIIIKNSFISINGLSFKNLENIQTVLLNSEQSLVKLQNAQVEGGSGLSSVIYLDRTQINGENIVFKENLITCLSASRSEVWLKYVEFINNRGASEDLPSNIIISNKIFGNNAVSLENISCFVDAPGLSLVFKNFRKLSLVNCSLLVSNSAPLALSLFYQGLLISDVSESTVESSKFVGFQAKRGSAAQVIATGDFSANLKINNSIFSNCRSSSGGALSLVNFNTTMILNSFFFANQALSSFAIEEDDSGIGGTGVLLCSPLVHRKCLMILENNSFADNYANLFGPLFISNSKINSQSFLVKNNNTDAVSYSDSSGDFPPKLNIALPERDPADDQFIDLEVYQNTSLINMEGLNDILMVRSGKPFKLEIILSDNKNQILTFDSKSTCSIENPLFAQKQTTVKSGFAIASKGRFLFSDLTLFNIPATTAELSVLVKIPRGTILNEEPMTLNFTLQFAFKPCVRGEIILSDFSCHRCPEGYFSYIDPMEGFVPEGVASNPQKCEICFENSVCPGGPNNYPRANYWRKFENGTTFLECFIPEACEGPGNFSVADLKGKCAEGHYGNMCNDCIAGFGKLNANFLCEPCEVTNRGAIVRLIFGAMFLFSYAIGGSYLYSIEDSEIKKHGFLFVYVKISLNFTQITTLLTFLSFTWILPSLKKIFSTSSNSLSFATEDVLLNDCLVQSSITEIDNIYAIKMIVIVFLPLILGLLTSAFWVIFYLLLKSRLQKNNKLKKLKEARKLFYIRLLASFIISIFLFHPLIIRSCFNMLNCIQLTSDVPKPESFLFVYPSFQCWTSFHYKVVFLFAIPGIIIWGFLFPALLLYVLVKQQTFRAMRMRTMRTQKKKESTLKPLRPTIYSDNGSHSYALKGSQKSLAKVEAKLTVYEFEGENIVPVEEYPDQSAKLQSQSSLPSAATPKKKHFFDTILKSNIFKFLYYGYKSEFTYWECFNFLKKLLISLLVNLNQILGYDIIVLLVILILIVSFWMQLKCKPFVQDDLNFLEILSHVSMFFIFVSIVMLSTKLPASLQYILGFLILFLYLIFSGATAFYVVKTIKETKLIKTLWDSFRSSVSPRRSDNTKERVD